MALLKNIDMRHMSPHQPSYVIDMKVPAVPAVPASLAQDPAIMALLNNIDLNS
jgi:hypothetical protein